MSFSCYAACRLTSFNNFFYPIRGLIIYSFINKQTYLPWRRVMFHSSPAFCACAFYLLYFGLFSNFFSKDDPRRTVFRKTLFLRILFRVIYKLREYKSLTLFQVRSLVNHL